VIIKSPGSFSVAAALGAQSESVPAKPKLDFAVFCPVGSDAGPEDRCFRDDAHGLFDGGGGASKGAERKPSFLPQ
jgi:hypothetical protein